MTRPIAYDATHLVTRLNAPATTGIDRVDLAYARHFSRSSQIACGVHYGLRKPHVLAPPRLSNLTDIAAREVERSGDGFACQDWRKLRAWLLGTTESGLESQKRALRALLPRATSMLSKAKLRIANDAPYSIPESAIYLNVAQHAFEYPLLFEWLARRPDVRAAFFVHDLLPLDYPEFFRRGYETRFRRRVETILRHASAIVTTSRAVADRVTREFAARGKPAPPTHVAPLPSPLEESKPLVVDRALGDSCYFVMVSTLEPRKNHLMLLNVWRALEASGGPVPKLVMVGNRGWENEQTIDMLRRSIVIRPHVRWVAGLSPASLRELIANARALLMPSFAEGYGLPIVEALSLGTPAIVSDIPVFREIAQNRAHFLSPIDASGWRDLIVEFASSSDKRQNAVQAARDFEKPNWERYFGSVEEFLKTI